MSKRIERDKLDKYVYRASGIYRCKRQLSAVRLNVEGEKAPDWLETAAEEGNLHEAAVKMKLGTEGYRILRDQKEVKISDDSLPFEIVGHIDGVVASPETGELMLLEIKSMSHFEFDRWMKDSWTGFPTYANQITVYWTALGLSKCLYIAKNRSSGYLHRQVLEHPPVDITGVLSHVHEVEDWVQEHGEVMPAEYDERSIECQRCRYKDVLECVKTIVIAPVDQEELELAEHEYIKGYDLEKWGKVLKKDAKEVFTHFCQQNELKGQSWNFMRVRVQLRDVHRKAYSVEATEYEDCSITIKKEKNNG